MMAGPETVSTTVRVADTITLVLSKYAFVGYALPVCQLVVVIDVILDDLTMGYFAKFVFAGPCHLGALDALPQIMLLISHCG